MNTHDNIYLVEDDYVNGLFEELKFFAPSPDLAQDILRLNDELGKAYFDNEYEEIATNAEPAPVPEVEPIKDENSFREFFKNVANILLHNDEEDSQRPEQSEEAIIAFFQAFIAERVFNHLAMLSRSSYAKRGHPFSIRDELTKEIAEKLGLGLYLHQKTSVELRAAAEDVLLRLAVEFQHWFMEKREGRFITTWGSIYASGLDIVRGDNSTHFLILIPDVETGEAHAAT